MKKRITFVEGVLVALVLALCGGLVVSALSWLFGYAFGASLTLTLVVFAYLVYLLWRAPKAQGRITALFAWSLTTGALWLINPGLVVDVVVQLGVISVIRSLIYYGTPMAVAADLGLTGLSVLLAMGAYLQTASIGISIWCLFLTQALFCFVPNSSKWIPHRSKTAEDAFDRARRNADAALRELSAHINR